MVTLTFPEQSYYDSESESFINLEELTVSFEYSLFAVSKWEQKHHISYLSNAKEATEEQLLDFYRCMMLDDSHWYPLKIRLENCDCSQQIKILTDYIQDPASATVITHNDNKPPSRKIITSELVYYWMSQLQIPFECDKWHINRLFKLIDIANVESEGEKKMSHQETAARNKALNAQRRAKLGTKG